MRECCTDHKGQPKRKYETQSEAEKVAKLRRGEGVNIKVYPCEEGNGWHLTSHNVEIQTAMNIMEQREISRYKQKSKNLLGSSIDSELINQMKQNVLSSIEKKIEHEQEKLDLQKEIFEKNKKAYIDIRQKLRLEEQELRHTEQEIHKLQNEYNQAKNRIERQRRY